MFGKKVKTGIASFAAAAALTAFAATDASATHFRYGTMNWTVDGSDATGRTVNFTFTEGWRVSDSITYNLGDGTTFNTSSNRTTIGNFTDANGEAYSVFSSTLTKTYASNSVFNLAGSNCCRISTLQNGNNDQWFNLTASVDLTAANAGNTGSPVAQAPVIVPMPITTSGTTTSFQLPFADPDNDSVTVSVAPAGTGSNSTTSGLSTALPTAGIRPARRQVRNTPFSLRSMRTVPTTASPSTSSSRFRTMRQIRRRSSTVTSCRSKSAIR
jgi:hypothetical protein